MNEIICGNNIEIMKKMKEGCIDLVVTSPPYDNLRTYKNDVDKSWGEHVWKPIIEQLYRVMKDGGVVVWVVGDATIKGSETGTSFKQVLYAMECGFNLHDTMIWHKPNSFNFGSNLCYRQSFEYMFVFSKGKIKTVNLIKDVPAKMGGKVVKGARKHANGNRDEVPDFVVERYKRRDNVWFINVGTKNHNHPAVFPEQLANDHIISWTNEGDVVFDPFVGSGTTCKMAKLNNRKYIGIDISEEYCDIARKRLEECE